MSTSRPPLLNLLLESLPHRQAHEIGQGRWLFNCREQLPIEGGGTHLLQFIVYFDAESNTYMLRHVSEVESLHANFDETAQLTAVLNQKMLAAAFRLNPADNQIILVSFNNFAELVQSHDVIQLSLEALIQGVVEYRPLLLAVANGELSYAEATAENQGSWVSSLE